MKRLTTEHIHPSGRQALTAALRGAGFSRSMRCALPEWSSHCVISAVGLRATPIPLAECLRHAIPVDGVLLYEQWGWPVLGGLEELVRLLRPRLILFDRIYSPDLERECRAPAGIVDGIDSCEVFSLSKILRLEAGGLLRRDGAFLPLTDAPADDFAPFAHPDWVRQAAGWSHWDDILKADIPRPCPSLLDWLEHNDLRDALDAERDARRANLEILRAAPLGARLPAWMLAAADQGCAPALAPLLDGLDGAGLKAAQGKLAEATGLAAPIYHFPMSGHLLRPEYRPCLAMPLDGSLRPERLAEALAALARD